MPVVTRTKCKLCWGAGYFRASDNPESTLADIPCDACETRGYIETQEPDDEDEDADLYEEISAGNVRAVAARLLR